MSLPSGHPSGAEQDPARLHVEVSGDGQANVAGGDQHIHYHPDGIRRVRSGGVVDECPYPGLAAFGPEQARWFFGRDELLAELKARLDERARSGGPVMVVAPSGAGKSSLLRAGLVPALEAGTVPGS
ncbi:MAG: ATP-binding protein, partial [Nonomuraea sp.]|nr:ATP-binding protein [Nonomuraea sp.]